MLSDAVFLESFIIMQPLLEHLPLATHESFFAGSFKFAYFPTPWHYHPEYEIVLVKESSGQRFIGNTIDRFKAGDLTFIGANVPHVYKNDPVFYEGRTDQMACSIVIHFSEKSFGSSFLAIPEMIVIRELLQRSKRGIDITGATRAIVNQKMEELLLHQGIDRLYLLLEILRIMAQTKEYCFISDTAIAGSYDGSEARITKVFDWLLQNFDRSISLSEVSSVANMTRTSFCRYFKQCTKRNFSDFLMEIRLNHAAKLLRETTAPVSSIGFNSGYENTSNFNRQFKAYYKQTPKVYRNLYSVR